MNLKSFNKFAYLLLIIFAALLTGCGDGGSSSPGFIIGGVDGGNGGSEESNPSIVVDEDYIALHLDNETSRQINARVLNASGEELDYYSDNTTVAAVSGDGLVSGISEGTAIITVSLRSNPDIKKTVTVKVYAPSQELKPAIVLDKDSITLHLDNETSRQINARVLNANGDASLNYSSDNTTVATVNGSGLITGISEGTAIITVSLRSNPDVKETVTVKVYAPSPELKPSIMLGEDYITLHLDNETSRQINARVLNANGDASLNYSSDNATVATVNGSGLITGVSEGTAIITVSLRSNPDLKETVTVRVYAPQLVPSIKEKIKEVYRSPGATSVYALTEKGELYTWGDNYRGELGLGDTNDRYAPEKILGIRSKIKKVYFSSSSVYALTEEGELYTWGSNGDGQLGLGDTNIRNAPEKVSGIQGKIKEVYFSSYSFSSSPSIYALTEEGNLYAWGTNNNGQLGMGDTKSRNAPKKVSGVQGKVKKVYSYSDSYYDSSIYALTEEGSLYAWGTNKYGQLGVGDKNDRHTPIKVSGITVKIKEIYILASSIYVLTENGELYAWGYNTSGRLGLEYANDYNAPKKVSGIQGRVKEIYFPLSSLSSVYALTEEGDLYAWGDNRYGQLGLGDTSRRDTPVKVSGITGKIKEFYYCYYMARSYYYSVYVLTEEGNLYAWGSNDNGELGLGDTNDRSTPEKVSGIQGKIKEVYHSYAYAYTVSYSYFYSSTYALTEEGDLYAWGSNGSGRLGLGDNESRYAPEKVSGIKSRIKGIYSSNVSFCALTEEGDLYTWGDGLYGKLGLGDTNDRNAPEKVLGIQGPVKEVYYNFSVYALTEEGDLYAWGSNGSGQLGLGNKYNHYSPEKVLFP